MKIARKEVDENQHLLMKLFWEMENKAEFKDGRLLVPLPEIAKILKSAGMNFEDFEFKLEGVE